MIIYMNLKTSNMKYKIVQSEEIVWSEENDRYIMIKKEGNDVIGLNFMQGNEFELFVENYMDIDHNLTDFYNSVKDYLSGESELDRVNQAIWAQFNYKNLKAERKYSVKR